MSVIVPGRRPAFPPIGRLRSSPLSGGKKSGFVSLNLTPFVDMFTIIVIFLIQMFTADQVTLNDRIHVPKSVAGDPLQDTGTIVMLGADGLLLVDNQPLPPDQMGTELDVAIPGLVTLLVKQREFRESIEGRDAAEAYQGLLIVQADVKTDFRIVRRVVASANEAGWAKFKFITTPSGTKTAAPAEG